MTVDDNDDDDDKDDKNDELYGNKTLFSSSLNDYIMVEGILIV